ncbi:MAG: hypothetical protein AYP45_12815 [Candidatus Brocadia carolinensis]|uniref:Uncharacterized protein n=1 Tax=Candidatus Brocadia carolinensis TaxID=1004156 RepID=A0A1V4ARQ9_9BACT|nr:MAG: hypothetical protein AYP45_12815 [Candidatus Brocadia caroliniensis]
MTRTSLPFYLSGLKNSNAKKYSYNYCEQKNSDTNKELIITYSALRWFFELILKGHFKDTFREFPLSPFISLSTKPVNP